jgi:DNA topoisomerase-1
MSCSPDNTRSDGVAERGAVGTDLRATASTAKLPYVSGGGPGIGYRHPDGSKVTDRETLDRIRELVIPPAYERGWICPYSNGHLQAVGRDARGRKQYRYHARWREVRDDAKYGKMLVFGKMLPRIRAQVERDLARPGLPRQKVLAAVVRLLESTMMRVGNAEYARTNKSYGLTTLRDRHVRINDGRIQFDFRGKRGAEWHIDLQSKRLATTVRRCQALPRQELFQYLDENDTPHAIDSTVVNDYLREFVGEDITAKDFRTWAGTNFAALASRELEAFDTQTKAKRNEVQAVEAVAKMLGNPPAICRKCYIHPAIFDGYLDGSLQKTLQKRANAELADPDAGLTAEEVAVMAFLTRQLTGPKRSSGPRGVNQDLAQPAPRRLTLISVVATTSVAASPRANGSEASCHAMQHAG